MKSSKTKSTNMVLPPVFPKTMHQFRPAKADASPKPAKRDNIFSQSRDTREDRGIREMKTSHSDQTNHAK